MGPSIFGGLFGFLYSKQYVLYLKSAMHSARQSIPREVRRLEMQPLVWRVQDGEWVAYVEAGRFSDIEEMRKALSLPPEPRDDGGRRTIFGAPVISPMAGIFYRRPKPEAEPYVEIGDKIQIGDTVGVIEVAKLFNYLVSPVGGKVIAIFALDKGQVAENEPLILVEPENPDNPLAISLEIDRNGQLISHRQLEEVPTELYICSHLVGWVFTGKDGDGEKQPATLGDIIGQGQPVCYIETLGQCGAVVPDHPHAVWSFGPGHPTRRYVDIPEDWGLKPPFRVVDVDYGSEDVLVQYGSPLYKLEPEEKGEDNSGSG